MNIAVRSETREWVEQCIYESAGRQNEGFGTASGHFQERTGKHVGLLHSHFSTHLERLSRRRKMKMLWMHAARALDWVVLLDSERSLACVDTL